jgi:hypothetical protein
MSGAYCRRGPRRHGRLANGRTLYALRASVGRWPAASPRCLAGRGTCLCKMIVKGMRLALAAMGTAVEAAAV